MIKRVKGDILLTSANGIAQGVNCNGIMGAGLAKQLAAKFPEMVKEYKWLCSHNLLQPGAVHFWWNDSDTFHIYNFATQWGILPRGREQPDPTHGAMVEYVDACLERFTDAVKERDEHYTVAMPLIGCGLGGLNWGDVERLFVNYLDPLPQTIYIYEKYLPGVKANE